MASQPEILMAYGVYRVKLLLKSAISGPWLADTISGHICWAVREAEGEPSLVSLLDAFRSGKPPFVFSDAFPGDLLPKPAVAEEVFDRVCPATERASLPDRLERLSRRSLLPFAGFEALRRGELFDVDAGLGPETEDPVPAPRTRLAVDRRTGMPIVPATSGTDAFLLPLSPEAQNPAGRPCSIYVKAADGWDEKIAQRLRDLSVTGMGGGASIGMGRFDLLSMDRFHFTPVEKANGFVSLSHFVPAQADPAEGAYGIRVKRGRLGRGFSGERPFKRPVMLLSAGSCFRTGSAPAEFYGRAIEGIAPARPEAVQVCFALALPVRLPWWGDVRKAQGA